MLHVPGTRSVVNEGSYCSVMKGLSHQKRSAVVLAVHQELMDAGLQSQFTKVTYNALIDACARCGEVSRATDCSRSW